jgi:hypothetical protein
MKLLIASIVEHIVAWLKALFYEKREQKMEEIKSETDKAVAIANNSYTDFVTRYHAYLSERKSASDNHIEPVSGKEGSKRTMRRPSKPMRPSGRKPKEGLGKSRAGKTRKRKTSSKTAGKNIRLRKRTKI